MKKILILISLVVSTAGAMAQTSKPTSFSIGPEIGFATGNFNTTNSFGIGATILGEYKFQPELAGTAEAGVISYSGRSISGSTKFKNTTIIPVELGIRYYPAPNFYGGLEAGVGFLSGAYTGSSFGYAIGLGTKLKISSKNIDLGLKYDAFSKSGTIAGVVIRVAYEF